MCRASPPDYIRTVFVRFPAAFPFPPPHYVHGLYAFSSPGFDWNRPILPDRETGPGLLKRLLVHHDQLLFQRWLYRRCSVLCPLFKLWAASPPLQQRDLFSPVTYPACYPDRRSDGRRASPAGGLCNSERPERLRFSLHSKPALSETIHRLARVQRIRHRAYLFFPGSAACRLPQ